MKKYFFFLISFLTLSCATVEKNKDLITSGRFNKNNLDFVPYFFNNFNKEFIKYEGDFLRVKYNDSLYLDMICYSNDNGLLLNIQSEDINLDELKIRAVSKNNGILIKNYYLNGQSTTKNKGLLFFKDFKTTEKQLRNKLIENDIVKIQLNNKEYEFLSPLK